MVTGASRQCQVGRDGDVFFAHVASAAGKYRVSANVIFSDRPSKFSLHHVELVHPDPGEEVGGQPQR
jgi:hypothetical protein